MIVQLSPGVEKAETKTFSEIEKLSLCQKRFSYNDIDIVQEKRFRVQNSFS